MKKNDWLLFGGVILFAGIVLLGYRIFTTEGTYVEVVKEGVVTERYALVTETEVTITTPYGVNILQIKDGYASVIDADCPDKLCVKQSRISKNGESLICLPHKLVIQITGSDERNAVDAVTG